MKSRILSIRFLKTALLLALILTAIMFCVPPIEAEPKKEPEKKTIKVAKHIVKGSGVTKDQLKKWDEEANKRWGCSLKFVEAGDPDEVEKVGDNNVPGAVNVYGVSKEVGVAGDFYGRATDQQYIEVCADAKSDSLAHEFGHFPGGDCSTDHKQNDTGNLMYSGCARNGTQITDEQQDRARRLADEWLKKANSKNDTRDAGGDTVKPFIDITYTSAWAQYNTLFLSIAVDFLVHAYSHSLGFFIESDQDPLTGEPPWGIDYKVYFDPQEEQIHFFRYDLDMWVPLDPDGISVKYLYEALDARVPVPAFPLEREIGIEFAIPISLLRLNRSANPCQRSIMFQAFSQFESSFDYCPDTGFSSIQCIEEDDIVILSVTPSKTVVGVGTTMSIGIIVWNEGNTTENFSVSTFFNDTLIGTSPVASLPPGNETTLLFPWNTIGIQKGKYVLSANATAVEGECDLHDNTYIRWGTIQATIIGDLNGDRKVNMMDIGAAALAFGSFSGHPRWNPNADVVEDNRIDMKDIGTVAKEFGKTYP